MKNLLNYIPQKILLIKLKKLGDVIGTTPITRQLRALFPNAEITFLTEPLGAHVYENSPRIDHLWVLSRKPSALEYLNFCYKIYKNKFDLVIDLYDHNKTALFTLVSFANHRLGFAKIGKSPISYNHTVTLSHTERISTNRIHHQLRLTSVLGTNLEDQTLEFEISDSLRKFGIEFSANYNFTSKTIAFCVQSERKFAQAPHDFFVKVGNYLLIKGYKLYFVYGPNERRNAVKVYNDMSDKSNCIINYEIPTVSQVRAIFENCVMYVGNDGGNKHIAMTAGICTIGFFYGDNPVVWTPNEPQKHRYLQTKNNENSFKDFVALIKNWDYNMQVFNSNK